MMIASAALIVAGRLLGLTQLWIVATAIVVLIAGCAAWTLRHHSAVSALRDLPEHLHVGSDGRVDITIVNQGSTTTATSLFVDSLDNGDRTARFALAPLRPGDRARAAYRVPTHRRGRFMLGPLQGTVGDPFGIARRTWQAADSQEVLIHPRVHTVNALPELSSGLIDTESRDVAGRPDTGGEFRALRDYQPSDDLRLVHWKSTAKRGRLIVREDESRRRAPVVLLLDVRTGAHDYASFERAVEATASIAAALASAQRPFSVVTSTGQALGQPGRRYLSSVLDELAIVKLGANRIVQPIGQQRAAMHVAVMGDVNAIDIAALHVMARGSALVFVGTRGASAAMSTPSQRVFVVDAATDDIPFVTVWNQAVSTWHGRGRTRSLA